jgi:hypothetical protein
MALRSTKPASPPRRRARRRPARQPASRQHPALAAWRSIVPQVQGLAAGLTDSELDRRASDDDMSTRELVHHLVEANVVAASITIAALGSPGAVYDWSWMMPFGAWMTNMRYDRKPIAPSQAMLTAVNDYVAAQVAPLADGLDRIVLLLDQPGAEPRQTTVAEVLQQEADHVRQHVEAARQRGRAPRRRR